MGLAAGPFYGILLFAVICLIMYLNNRRRSSLAVEAATVSHTPDIHLPDYRSDPSGRVKEDALVRMKELQELRAANMISDAEYEQKRA